MIGKLFVYKNIRMSDDRCCLSFDYQVDTDECSFSLTETLTLPSALPQNATADRILRALHLALGISYYKTFLPPEINHAYTMDQDEADFWNTVFRNGLGEFLYKNNLSVTKLATFSPQTGTINPAADQTINWQDTALLGIGGGKDSIVAGELLKSAGVDVKGFVLATGQNKGQAEEVSQVMKVPFLAVERRLDPQILDMNKLDGALNGHVPISLIFALIGCLLAVCQNSRYVIVANEASASIPQVQHEGSNVNHQWSKSLEFEQLFQNFVHRSISSDLHYTSIIRPLTSIAVAKLFANFPAYFEVFSSDNALLKMDATSQPQMRWGLHSTKSLSSYILLAPWMSDADVARTFGHDFLDQTELSDLFIALLGKGDKPVLDCVGTPDELRLSLSLLHEQKRYVDAVLMQTAANQKLLITQPEHALKAALEPSSEHAIPADLEQKIFIKITELLTK